MSTSLREQLLKLQTPQSSQFFDSKRRDSILFTQKDAATKSRETIYEIGLSGLKELIEIDELFAEFENTLFDFTVKDVQRAVETDEVNRLLNKNIKKFMFYLSPYFLIPSSHKCLEWLIRRFNINLYNKEEMLMLILPYHQTNMFVRCIQIMKFDDPSDKWDFLSEVKKTSSPLSKLTLWNYGTSQPAFLEFVGKFTYEAVKELDRNAGKLQTMISFYFTSIVGSLEQATKINDNHILTVSKYLVKTFKSNILDYTAAGYMITAQLLTKASLKEKLLYEIMDRITKSVSSKLLKDCVLVLALMFQTQTDDLKISDITLHNLMQIKGIIAVLKQIKNEGKLINDFYKAMIYKLLINIQENDENSQMYKEFCKNLINEIDMDDDLAYTIIRTILDSYVQEETKNGSAPQTDDEVITIDSDDENIPLKSQDVTIWYSDLLRMLERQYPTAFDLVVKSVMTRNPGRKRHGLKNVLGFLLNVSCSTNDTNIFENLYHHNSHIRSEAVSYLVKNLKSIERTPENIDILKMTLSERLNDDNPLVVHEMLKIDFKFLKETVGSDELVARLSKILMKFWSKQEKWRENAKLALKVLTCDVYDGCSDANIVLISLLPFLFSSDVHAMDFVDIIKNSNYSKTKNTLKNLPNVKKDHIKFCEAMNEFFNNNKNLPSTESILATIKNVAIENHQLGSFKENFAFYLLACSMKNSIDHQLAMEILQAMIKVYNFPNTTFNNLLITDNNLKNHEMSTNLVATVLTKMIKCMNITNFHINFANPNAEMKLLLDVFNFIVDLYFKVQQSYRSEINGIMIEFLDRVCESNEMKKLEFLSQFCVMHAAQYENSIINLELQVRVMNLLQHVLKSNLIDVQNYSNSMHQNVVLSLCAKSNKIRELGIEIVEILEKQNIAENWKFFYGKIVSRKSEILMDHEQIKMVMYLLATKKPSKYIQDIKDNMLKTINNGSFDYIQSELLMLLKHFTDKKVLDISAQIAMKIIEEFHHNGNYYFNENHAAIIKLVLMKFNHATVSGLWDLAVKSLQCHYIMNDEDGKILTPSILLLQSIDNELYAKLHADHKVEIFNAIIECSMNEQPRITQMAQKVFCSINLDYKIIRNSLLKLTKSTQKKNVKSFELFESKDWKFGVAILELLQNKTKDIEGGHELISILFDILQNCLRSADSDMEYIKQIILSLLLTISKQISSSGKNHRALGINDSVFKTELIIRCIKETQNPQTHHHSLLLLAQLALMIPDQVLRDIMTIFTFVGTTLVRHDDSYSFQIITKIIENIIPNFLKGAKKEEVVPILKTFAAIALDVPVHRRLMLYVKLMNTFGAENYLWMFIATLLEIQVSQHQKGNSQEDLPVRLQIALSIAKEFDIKTIIVTATSLIVYLKELPMIIDNTKSKIVSTNSENEIFCLKTHTSGQIRHFKYLVSLFLKYILESPEISNMAHQMSQDKVTEMRTQFQDLILNTLILIPDITKFIELKQHEKSWQIILQTSFDILEASIALLAPDMLLIVVERLICHDFLVVRKKVLELLNRKLEDNYFKACENQKLLKLMVPLKNVYESIGEQNSKLAEEVVQQLALITIKLLAAKLCEESPEPFIECLNHLTNVLVDKNARIPVMINLVDCTAELVGELKVHSISLLGKIMPNLVKLLTLQNDNPSTLLLLHSTTSSLLRIIETVPLFLSPYLVQIILQLIRVYPILKLVHDTKISLTLNKIHKIWETFAESIPTRILIPTIHEIYDKVIQKKQFTSIEPLMELMNELFQRADIKDIKGHQAELTEFFLKALQFRCNIKIDDEINFNEINDIELFIIRALISLILKQSEGSFRPLFENISNWAIKDKEENDNNRLITFFRLTTEISIALKSLFLLFASDLVECAGPILDKCNSSKDELMFEDNVEKTLYLVEYILRTLHNMFLNDHQNFINSHRFGQIMQPIVDQMENIDALKNEDLLQSMRMTIAQLAVAASDDILWKQLNHQVLLKTRSENPEIRILGVKTCVDIARKLTEDYETLIPETIPFLSELLADEDYHVVQACENAVRELETIVGESLQKYF